MDAKKKFLNIDLSLNNNDNYIDNNDNIKNINDSLNNIFSQFINRNINLSNKFLFLKEIISTLNNLLKLENSKANINIDDTLQNIHKGSDYPIYPLSYYNPEEFYSDIYNYL